MAGPKYSEEYVSPLSLQQKSEADTALRIHSDDSSKAGSEIDSFVAAGGPDRRDTADSQDIAAALLGIQDQLAELRQLVRRNLAGDD